MIANLSPFSLLFVLICGHMLADFALQNEWVATNKNRHVRDRYTPEQLKSMSIIWPHLLTAHSFHHGLMVFLITGRISLAIAETVLHWITDFSKCEGWIGFHLDQAIHIALKVVYVILIAQGLV